MTNLTNLNLGGPLSSLGGAATYDRILGLIRFVYSLQNGVSLLHPSIARSLDRSLECSPDSSLDRNKLDRPILCLLDRSLDLIMDPVHFPFKDEYPMTG